MKADVSSPQGLSRSSCPLSPRSGLFDYAESMREKDSSMISGSHLLTFIVIFLGVTLLMVTGISFIHIAWYAALVFLSLGLILTLLAIAGGLIPSSSRRRDNVGIALGLVNEQTENGDESHISGFIMPVLVLIVPATCILLLLWIFGLQPDSSGLSVLVQVLKWTAIFFGGIETIFFDILWWVACLLIVFGLLQVFLVVAQARSIDYETGDGEGAVFFIYLYIRILLLIVPAACVLLLLWLFNLAPEPFNSPGLPSFHLTLPSYYSVGRVVTWITIAILCAGPIWAIFTTIAVLNRRSNKHSD